MSHKIPKILETRVDKKIFTKQGFFVRYDDSATFVEVAYNLIKWGILVFSAVFFAYMISIMFFLKPIFLDGGDGFFKTILICLLCFLMYLKKKREYDISPFLGFFIILTSFIYLIPLAIHTSKHLPNSAYWSIIVLLLLSGFLSFYGAKEYIISFLQSGKIYLSDSAIITMEESEKTQERIPNLFYRICINSTIGGFFSILFIFLWLGVFHADNFLTNILFIIVVIVVFPLCLFLIQMLYQKIHPLYAFGNIGEKIQKLTPEIASQSKVIQTEFRKNQNFGVLHSGFEKLAVTFSRIGELVLKLERIEKKANKGNLFDSEKYIGSLRTDIVTPLMELKSFLEKQREELLTSQKELSKVMVGESSELSGNRELATKRGEEILSELDGNIGKLEEMIGKMG